MATKPRKMIDHAVELARRLPGSVRRGDRSSTQTPLPEPSQEPSLPQLNIPPRRALPPDPEMVAVPDLVPGTTGLLVWPQTPPAGYLGQLEPAFQDRLAKMWERVSLQDCYFYHRVRLKDGRVIDGTWNLLDGEEEYLGSVPLAGRRVLELGPATGWLTTWMEQQGAKVVGFDLGFDLAPDLIPLPGLDLDQTRRDQVAFLCRVQNAWWFLHREYGLSAQAVYGSIYDLPADIGRFDVSIFGSILLHLRDPFLALYQAALRTDEAIVIVEPLVADKREVDQPLSRWNPTRGANPNGWWTFSPGLFTDMLAILGFPDSTVTYHRQPFRPETNPTGSHFDAAQYTVVARRV